MRKLEMHVPLKILFLLNVSKLGLNFPRQMWSAAAIRSGVELVLLDYQITDILDYQEPLVNF